MDKKIKSHSVKLNDPNTLDAAAHYSQLAAQAVCKGKTIVGLCCVFIFEEPVKGLSKYSCGFGTQIRLEDVPEAMADAALKILSDKAMVHYGRQPKFEQKPNLVDVKDLI